MSVSSRIQESTKRVEASTLAALESIDQALDNAEAQRLRVLEVKGACPHVLAVLGRLGGGLIPIEQGEVAIAQALVQDVGNGVSDDLGFGRQAGAEQVQTQTITLGEKSSWTALQGLVREGRDHAVAFRAQ